MPLRHHALPAIAATVLISGHLCAQVDGIFADFDVGEKSDPGIPGHLSFSIYLDTATGPGDYDTAPRLVANFIRLAEGEDSWIDSTTGLAEKLPFFDNLPFFQVSKNRRIDFGSRDGTGTDNPGWVVQDEFYSDVGTNFALFMDNEGPNTNGSRYFISWNTPDIDTTRYPRLGYVLQDSPVYPGLDGRSNVAAISRGDAIDPETINSVTIRRVGSLAADFDEDSWRLPDVISTGFGIHHNGTRYRLRWSDVAGSVGRYFGSADLVNWEPFEGYDPPGAIQLGVDITSRVSSGLPGFYRGSAVHYPDWPAQEFDTKHTVVRLDYDVDGDPLTPTKGRYVLDFDGGGVIGSWQLYFQSFAGGPYLLDRSGTFVASWTTQQPFVGFLNVNFSPDGPAVFQLHFDYHAPFDPVTHRFGASTSSPPFFGFEGEWIHYFQPN